jgi:predicted DNA-binding transcriptional regulator AlpA
MMQGLIPLQQIRFMGQRPKFDVRGRANEYSPHAPATFSIPEAEMLTAADLEALLKIDIKTIYRYAQRGLIPYVRIQSNLRFRKREILEWINRQSYRPQRCDSSTTDRP